MSLQCYSIARTKFAIIPLSVKFVASVARLILPALIAFSGVGMLPARADAVPPQSRILIKKSARKMFLIHDGHLIDDFTISLGGNPLGPKVKAGDERTPEGTYTVNWKNPHSHYFLSLHLSYPNPANRARAAALDVNPGSDIMIHGLPNDRLHSAAYYRNRDWTHGCIAVSDQAMRVLWKYAQPGTVVQIEP